MKLTTTRRSISRITGMLAKTTLSIIVITGVGGVLRMHPAIATPPPQQSPILVATAYTDLTLPTLRQGDRGRRASRRGSGSTGGVSVTDLWRGSCRTAS
jgi:hypothetical protein